VRELLALHGLQGRQAEERTPAEKETPINPAALAALFTDLGQQDPFLDDLYVGFLVGLLARHQERLFVEHRRDETARVWAGGAAVVLHRKKNKWQISLAESIPGEIKKRALKEKTRLEQASPAAPPVP
jgi:hypothetical protein